MTIFDETKQVLRETPYVAVIYFAAGVLFASFLVWISG